MTQNVGGAGMSQRDVDLLYKMYKYRALSTDQVAKIGGYKKSYIHHKIINMRKEGLIYTQPITGRYILHQNRQGSFHRVTGKSISILKNVGYEIKYKTDDLRVTKYHLPYLLIANELAIDLKKHNWEFKDSRQVKLDENLHRNDMIHGSLTDNNGKEYALYLFLQKVRQDNLIRAKREIERIPLHNVLVTARSKSSFESLIDTFMDPKSSLIKSSVRVLPKGFAKIYFKIFNGCSINQRLFLKKIGLNILEADKIKQATNFKVNYDYMVKHNNKEKYLVNLLDNDLMKMRDIKRYRKEDFNSDGRRVLVLTSNQSFHVGLHNRFLKDIRHVEYLKVNTNEIVSYANSIHSEEEPN